MLPLNVLHGVSRVLRFVLFDLVGYRKKIIRNNILNSFPEKTDQERKSIEREFQLHFCDLIVESIKNFSISEEQVFKRMTFENTEVFKTLGDQNKSIILVGGHYGNWELFALAIARYMPHECRAFYTPLSNAFWDKKMKQSRSKYGLQMYSIKKSKELFAENASRLTCTIFATDQSPRNPSKAYWTSFLNQDTGVQFGAEKFSQEYAMPVVFGEMKKIKRGYYHIDFKILIEQPERMPYGEITEVHTRALESQIQKAPEYYLWTHRRWKHKRPNS